MNRPKVMRFTAPRSVKEVPFPIAEPGGLLQTNAGFRSMRPILDSNHCVKCMMCYALCPEGTIYMQNEKLIIDFDFCKGCGICAVECKFKAIKMVREDTENV